MPEFINPHAFHLAGSPEKLGPLLTYAPPSPASPLLRMTLTRGRAEVKGISPRCLRVRISQHPRLLPYRSVSLDPRHMASGDPEKPVQPGRQPRPHRESTADIPSHPLTFADESSFYLRAATEELSLKIDTTRFALSLYGPEGELLTEGRSILRVGEALQDRRKAPRGQEYFGLGEKVSPLSRRHSRIDNWNRDQTDYHNENTEAMYCSVPFFLAPAAATPFYGEDAAPAGDNSSPEPPPALKWWGYFLDSPYRSHFDMASTSTEDLTISLIKGDLVIYFMAGSSPAAVLEEYTRLTGRHPLPPRWALGYHQCRHSYATDQEALGVAENLRQRQIPCDALWYDIFHMDNFRVFTFSREGYPHPKDHFDRIHALGFHTVAIVDPGIKVDPPGVYPVMDEGRDKDYFIKDVQGKRYHGPVWPGGVHFPDFSREEVRRWWADLHRFYFERGIDAVWNDMNEPAVLDELQTVPLEYLMYDEGHWSSQERMHNLYALLEAQSTQRALREAYPGRRPFVLTRAGFAGIQRYAALWTGDNDSTWDHMKQSLSQILNLGLSGIGFCGADVGGFSGNCHPELLVRWMQLGAFYPFFRSHSSDDTIRQEPWAFGPEAEGACRRAIELRYRLIPYWEQLFEEMSRRGTPAVRPLFWHTDTPEGRRITDQFFIGPSIMAAPILEKGARERMVYLPPGDWYNGGSREFLEGGRFIIAPAPLTEIPFFIKAGTILPTAPEVPHTGALPRESLSLEAYLTRRGQAHLTWREIPAEGPVEAREELPCHRFDSRGPESLDWMPPAQTGIKTLSVTFMTHRGERKERSFHENNH